MYKLMSGFIENIQFIAHCKSCGLILGTSFKFGDEHLSVPSVCAWDFSTDNLIQRSAQNSTVERLWECEAPTTCRDLSRDLSCPSRMYPLLLSFEAGLTFISKQTIFCSLCKENSLVSKPDIFKPVTLVSADFFKGTLLVLSSTHFNSRNTLAAILCMADSLQRLRVLETYTTFTILDMAPQRMPQW